MARQRKKFKPPYKSGFEVRVGDYLEKKGIKFQYEKESFIWHEHMSKCVCYICGEKGGYIERKYTPDFFLENGIILETKGFFAPRDRKILLGVLKKNPELDLRILFQKDNKLSRSNTRYSEWCLKNDIKFAFETFPKSWE